MAGLHSKNILSDKTVSVTDLVSRPYKKGDTLPALKIIIPLTALLLVIATVCVAVFFSSGVSHAKLLEEAKEIFYYSGGASNAFDVLTEQNSDIKAWLSVEDTNIDSAVCQTDNDTYYINHNQLKKKSRYGALFLSCKDDISRKNGDKNLVIYGNNMTDGTMLGGLKSYRNLNFYKNHPVIRFTLYDNRELYFIFSVMLIGSSIEDNDGYNVSKSYFADEAEFDNWLKDTRERSIINTGVEVTAEDEFLTLITVADDFDGARLAVVAKKVDSWGASFSNADGATVNATPKYPASKGIK